MENLIMDHLVSGTPPFSVSIELTSKCNLRCRYCSMDNAKDSYKQQVMPEKLISHAMEIVKESHPPFLGLSGRGEITTVKGWEALLARFKGMAPHTHVVTNLSVSLTWDQACALAELGSITISIDSVDHKLMNKIRKGCDLDKLISNVVMIKAAARYMGRPKPNMSIISVATAASIIGFSRVAALAVELGVSSLSLQDLVFYYEEENPEVDARHISVLSPEEMNTVRGEVVRANEILSGAGVGFQVYTPFIQFLTGTPVVTERLTSHLGPHLRTTTPVPEGHTRNCRMPWDMAILLADGGIEPCCGAIGSVGNFAEIKSFADIPSLPRLQALRRELLTGQLSAECRMCCQTSTVPVEEFQKIISDHVVSRAPA